MSRYYVEACVRSDTITERDFSKVGVRELQASLGAILNSAQHDGLLVEPDNRGSWGN